MPLAVALTVVLPALLWWYYSLLNNYVMPERDLTGIWVSYIPRAAVILFALWNFENEISFTVRYIGRKVKGECL